MKKEVQVDPILKANLEFLKLHAAKVAEAKAYLAAYAEVETRVKDFLVKSHDPKPKDMIVFKDGVKTLALMRANKSTSPQVSVSMGAIQRILAQPGGKELIAQHFEFKFISKRGYSKPVRETIEQLVGPVFEYGPEKVSTKLDLV